MPIKDLKNTTWLLKDTISVPPLVDSDSIYASSNGVEGSLGVYTSVPSMEQTLTIGDVTIYNFTSNTWTDEKYKLCTVTGGNLTANAEMISWFQTNGKFNTNAEDVVANIRKSKEVSDALLSSANAKTGKSDANLTDAVKTLLEGYGKGGESGGGGIIEVDELPEVGVDGAIYSVKTFADAYVISNAFNGSAKQMVESQGGKVYCYKGNYVQGLLPPSGYDATLCYFIDFLEDEETKDLAIGLFDAGGSGQYIATAFGVTFKGEITDTTQATDDGVYAYMKLTLYQYTNGEFKKLVYEIPTYDGTITVE